MVEPVMPQLLLRRRGQAPNRDGWHHDDTEEKPRGRIAAMPERVFGHIPGYPEDSRFESRAELSEAGVHRPLIAGISGSEREGADSIALSGGYEDDEDLGDEVVYTGHGGRDAESGKQVAHQRLTRGNLALAHSGIEGLPVRVIRGANLDSQYAPRSGYRYDGLYIHIRVVYEGEEGEGVIAGA
jgi:hypothetical protein